MKKTDDIRVWAYSSTNGKEISKFFIDGSMGYSDYTNLLQIKKSMLNRIPKDYYEKKIIINIHNLTSRAYNTFIVKNPNEKLLGNSYNTGRSWSQDHKRYNKAENYERVPALRKTKASNYKNLQEKTKMMKVTSNKSARTFTIKNETATYRTYKMSKQEFASNQKNTENDWKQFLKTDEYYRVK